MSRLQNALVGGVRAALAKASCRHEARSRHHRISGGSIETLVKLFTVIPIGPRGVMQVTTVTPVANRPSASRICRWVSGAGMKLSIISHLLAFVATLCEIRTGLKAGSIPPAESRR